MIPKVTHEWAERQLRFAYDEACKSPDRSTQNGALVFDEDLRLVGLGCNTFTDGMVVTPDLHERPKKYAYIEHAERNSIYDACRKASSPPVVMVCPWAACADCARAIIQSGIRVLVRHERSDGSGRWVGSIEDGDIMLAAAGVEIITIYGPIGMCDPILFSGESYNP